MPSGYRSVSVGNPKTFRDNCGPYLHRAGSSQFITADRVTNSHRNPFRNRRPITAADEHQFQRFEVSDWHLRRRPVRWVSIVLCEFHEHSFPAAHKVTHRSPHPRCLLSFATPTEKEKFLDLIRSNDDSGNEYIDNAMLQFVKNEIQNARLASGSPQMALARALSVATFVCSSAPQSAPQ